MSFDPDDMWQQLEGRILEESGPRAALGQVSTRWRALLVAGWGMVPLVFVGVVMRRVDWPLYPKSRLVAELAVSIVLWWTLLQRWIRPIHRAPPPAWRDPVTWLVGTSAIVVLGCLPAAHLEHAASLGGLGSEFLDRASRCWAFGTTIAAVVGLGLFAVDRGQGAWGFAAAMAGVMGIAALSLHCPIVHWEHRTAGHSSIWLTCILVGWVAARWLAAPPWSASSGRAH